MNLKLAAFVSCLALSPAAQACDSYNGWMAGISGGWVGSIVKLNGGFSSFASANNNPKFDQAIYGIHADWIQTEVDNMVLGLGFALGFHSNNKTKTLVSGAKSGNGYVSNSAIRLRQKRKFFTEVTLRAGTNLGNAIVYALASVKATNIEYQLTGKLKYNGTNVLNGSNSSSYYAYGFAPGVGFDVKIDQNWSFGLEYRYFFETSKKVLNNNVRLKLDSHNLLARLSYHF